MLFPCPSHRRTVPCVFSLMPATMPMTVLAKCTTGAWCPVLKMPGAFRLFVMRSHMRYRRSLLIRLITAWIRSAPSTMPIISISSKTPGAHGPRRVTRAMRSPMSGRVQGFLAVNPNISARVWGSLPFHQIPRSRKARGKRPIGARRLLRLLPMRRGMTAKHPLP